MLFLLSKLLWIAANPANLGVVLLLVGAAGLWSRWTHLARFAVTAAAGLFLVGAVLPTGQWLSDVLEGRFPANPPLPARVDGIIVLGGSVEPHATKLHSQPALNGAAERLLAFADLSRRYPAARLVFTGGSGALTHRDLSEAEVARAALAMMGVDGRGIVFEDQSSNTYENALYSKRLVSPRPDESWILVTSAAHMPRSVGVFRRAGWRVIPFPVDYRSEEFADADASRRLEHFTGVLREWVGLVAYRAMDRTDALFPAAER